MDTRGLGGRWADFQRHWFGSPPPDLAPFVHRYWAACWDLRGQEPYRQLVAPSVAVQWTFVDREPGVVWGPTRRFDHRVLQGAGRVFGVAFRPGAFRPFLPGPVSALTGRCVPMRSVFGRDLVLPSRTASADAAEQLLRADELVEQLLRADEPSAERLFGVDVPYVEQFLRAALPSPEPAAADAVALIVAEPAVTRVDQLADRLGLGVRALQRLFAEHVGLGPKWCIRRYRIAEAAKRLEAGSSIDWATLAVELGYADQAHFSRDFTAILGEPPTRYALRYPA